MSTQYYFKKIKTPVGDLKLIGSQKGLYAVLWNSENPTSVKLPNSIIENNEFELLVQTEKELQEYFAGKRTNFSISLDSDYGTDFQKSAWNALKEISYGEVRTYAEQAVAVKNPKAVRAIGSANGKNPLSIIVPCHRVISSDGTLGGFGGGLEVKEFLLNLERNNVAK